MDRQGASGTKHFFGNVLTPLAQCLYQNIRHEAHGSFVVVSESLMDPFGKSAVI